MSGAINPFATYGRSKGRADRIDADTFRRMVEQAKQQHNLTDVVALNRKVQRSGREMVALCAFHSERTPSMRINDAKGTFHCFGCGESGDIVQYVMATQGLDFMGAMRWLGAADLPAVDPSARAKAAEEDAAERAAAIAEAQAVFDKSVPAAGTPAEVYLRSRSIVMPPPPSIRFVETYAWRDKDTGELGPNLPAMIGAVRVASGELIGLQRIFLRDGGIAKASMKKPKKSLGRIKGGAMRVGDPRSLDIVITEGPEDALSLAQEMPGREVMAVLGTAMMPFVDYPRGARVTIAGQNDNAGRAAVDAAALAIVEKGFQVRTIYPSSEFKDWNDQLRGIRL